MLYEMTWGELPYKDPTAIINYQRSPKILRTERTTMPIEWETLYESCLQYLPAARPTFKMILEWDHYQKSYEFLMKLRQPNKDFNELLRIVQKEGHKLDLKFKFT